MVEDLQNLLDKIHRDGAERAQADADRIVAEAKAKAKEIVAAAEAQAAENLASAERDSLVYVERATATLEQAARDYVLRVQQGVESLLRGIVHEAVAESLTPEVMADMLVKVANAYEACAVDEARREARLSVLIPPADADRFVELALGTLRARLRTGLDVHIDDSLTKGFRVSIQDDKMFHDFTAEAIADTLADSLRPRLREIVRRATQPTTA